MPSAAPGVIARGALRQTVPATLWASAQHLGRAKVECSSRSRAGIPIRPVKRRFEYWLYFTGHYSAHRVECGRLGEVESVVGDCRPPPPGNPRRLASWRSHYPIGDELDVNPSDNNHGSLLFIQKWHENGGVFLPIWKHCSFNIPQNTSNLKKLNLAQYFKIISSYFTCTQKPFVLEFGDLHYHLYGDWLVELPYIAITNVLET